MGKIATEQEAYSIGNVGTPMGNKCCTKARAEALGCKVSGTYLTNQLVQKEHLSKAYVLKTIGIYIDIEIQTGDGTTFNNVKNYAIGTLKISCGNTFYETYNFKNVDWRVRSDHKSIYVYDPSGTTIYAPESGPLEANFEFVLTDLPTTDARTDYNITSMICDGSKNISKHSANYRS